MAVSLDLRMPSVVVVGFWNQAILNEPAWIAQYIMEAQDGQNIEIGTVLVGDSQTSRKTVNVFDRFGISCPQNRLELYQSKHGAVEDIYETIEKIAKLLPHTPVSAIGTNFHVSIAGEVEAINSRIETGEMFDGLGRVVNIERTELIELSAEIQIPIEPELAGPCILKLQRTSDFGAAQIDFNFHQQISDIDVLLEWKKHTPIHHWQEIAFGVLKEQYAIEIDKLEHTFF